MKKKDLISKWLDHNLDVKELEAFKKLEASTSLEKLDQALKHFKAPEFSAPFNKELITNQPKKEIKKLTLTKLLITAAAVLIIGLSLVYFYPSNTFEDLVATNNTENTTFTLPDLSEVSLNDGSTLYYSKEKFTINRKLKLEGEAYFKVAKGKTFSVESAQGIVKVLGTQFNVNARKNFFEVTCYEGLVSVTTNNKTIKLPAGNTVKVYNNQLEKNTINFAYPSWTKDRSEFKSIPYQQVVEEAERQYNIVIKYNNNLSQKLFTGSFTHKNIESALQAITIPLNLSYEIKNNQVTFK